MSIMELGDKIPEFDYETGMAYCGDDEEFFAEMLSDYVNSGKDESLPKFYAAKDWVNYEIDVHALKSTSRMMGLPELGDKCEELQKAAGEKDEVTLSSKHDIMMKDYLKYLEIIREVLE